MAAHAWFCFGGEVEKSPFTFRQRVRKVDCSGCGYFSVVVGVEALFQVFKGGGFHCRMSLIIYGPVRT